MKSHTKIFLFTGYVTIKYLKYLKIKSVNPIQLIFSKVTRYFEETDNMYLTLVPTNERKN